MKKLLVLLIVCCLLITGCTSNDPLTDDLYTSASFARVDSSGNGGYWHEYIIDAFSLSPGGSGATIVPSNISTLGGYNLNAFGEFLYYTCHVEDDWDGVSNGTAIIWFEVNIDNTLGLVTDEVAITVESYYKSEGELANTNVTHEATVVVGQSDQHELFSVEITMDYLSNEMLFSHRINLNTVVSDIDNIIVNYIEFKYPAFYPGAEI